MSRAACRQPQGAARQSPSQCKTKTIGEALPGRQLQSRRRDCSTLLQDTATLHAAIYLGARDADQVRAPRDTRWHRLRIAPVTPGRRQPELVALTAPARRRPLRRRGRRARSTPRAYALVRARDAGGGDGSRRRTLPARADCMMRQFVSDIITRGVDGGVAGSVPRAQAGTLSSSGHLTHLE